MIKEPTIGEIREASYRIKSHVHHTPGFIEKYNE